MRRSSEIRFPVASSPVSAVARDNSRGSFHAPFILSANPSLPFLDLPKPVLDVLALGFWIALALLNASIIVVSILYLIGMVG
jgi:hypothetical protein